MSILCLLFPESMPKSASVSLALGEIIEVQRLCLFSYPSELILRKIKSHLNVVGIQMRFPRELNSQMLRKDSTELDLVNEFLHIYIVP